MFLPSSIELKVGESTTITSEGNISLVSGSVSDKSIATFSKNTMKVIAKSAGEVTLTLVYTQPKDDSEEVEQLEQEIAIVVSEVTEVTNNSVDLSLLEQYIGREFLINKTMNRVDLLSRHTAMIVYKNAINTHGKDALRLFIPKKETLKELKTILETYSNNILKA